MAQLTVRQAETQCSGSVLRFDYPGFALIYFLDTVNHIGDGVANNTIAAFNLAKHLLFFFLNSVNYYIKLMQGS